MIPTLSALKPILFEEDKCIEFLFDQGILYQQQPCFFCGGQTTRHEKRFRCRRKQCRKSASILSDSFFAKEKLSVDKALLIGYLWLVRANYSTIKAMTGQASSTVTTYMSFYRSLVSECLLDTDQRIGGEGVIVELDESKFGKRKYNRGHHVEGVWVVGGVERTRERRVFARTVKDRSASTLLKVIEENVLPGSIVYTDLWRGYSGIEAVLGMPHFTVNHSEGFIDPVTGVHTNTIEGTWSGIKCHVPLRNRTERDVSSRLTEFIWRRQNKDNLWGALLVCLKDSAYID
jgi:transposase-like protein